MISPSRTSATESGHARFRLGVDVGGTFTDLCLFDSQTGAIHVHKTPTNVEDQSVGVLLGIDTILAAGRADSGALGYFAHGTTSATNAMLEGRFSKTGLVTTAGFKDILSIGRQKRPRTYDLMITKPADLIPRQLRCEVAERVSATGEILQPLDLDECRVAIQSLLDQDIEALVIGFLHAYLRPEHEQQVADLAREMAPGLAVWTTSEVLPEFREYERLSTTAVNAVLGSSVSTYLGNLKAGMRTRGAAVTPLVMQSNGGVMSIDTAARFPANTLMSGPSAGVIGAARVAADAGHRNIITFDMGGTSIDVSLVRDGTPAITAARTFNGYSIRTPMLDIHSVGAGGGSVATIDSGGRLRVGPRSMGANPGPASYGLGGQEPTVTDANVVLGRLGPAAFLNGSRRLDPDLARTAIEKHIAAPLGTDVVTAAAGIINIVNTNMMLATRHVSIERGDDPRDFTFVPYGGAGPLHAADVARELNMPHVLVPRHPGLVCALGLLLTDLRMDFVKSLLRPTADADVVFLNQTWRELEESAHHWLSGEGVAPEDRVLQRSVDMRYARQSHELTVQVRGGAWDNQYLADLPGGFDQQHDRVYGFNVSGEPTHIVNFRVSAYGAIDKPAMSSAAPERALGDARIDERPVYWLETRSFLPTAIYDRELLATASEVVGPAVLEQMDSTVLVPPRSRARVDSMHNLLIDLTSQTGPS